MHPRMSIIAAAIRKLVVASATYTSKDPWFDRTSLNMRMEADDPYWDKVTLQMHMNDTGLTDVKGHTVSLFGNAARSATQSKFGGFSAAFDGTGDYLSVANASADCDMSGTFTFECWYYPNSLTVAPFLFMTNGASGVNAGNNIYIETTGAVSVVFAKASSPTTQTGLTTAAGLVTSGAWNHIAVTKVGLIVTVFVNGIKALTSTLAEAVAAGVSTRAVVIGAHYLGTVQFANGYIDDMRFTKNVERYTASFNVPTAAYPDPLPVDDKSHVITVFGNTIIQGGIKKNGTGSCYFDGSGDYLTTTNSSGEFNIGSQDFTIECYVRFASVSGVQMIFDGRVPSGGDIANAWCLGLSSGGHAGKIVFGADTTSGTTGGAWDVDLFSTTSPSIDTWYHVAVVRYGNTWTLYINGASEASVIASTTVGASGSTISIGGGLTGASTYGYFLNGYLDDLRITKGIARYTTAPFVPTAIGYEDNTTDPYYTSTAVLLRMNGTNASTVFTDESYSPKTFTANGNAQLSTGLFRHGTASGFFDGTGDYLTAPYNANFNPDTDFTCEAWIYPQSNAALRAVCGPYSNPAGTFGWLMYTGTSGELALVIRDSSAAVLITIQSPASQIALGKWQHIAWTKLGTLYTLWHNGVNVASGTAAGTPYSHPSHPFIVGRWDDAGTNTRDYMGYIDDLRVTKGVARYQAAFTPPGALPITQDPDVDAWWINGTVLAMRMDGAQGATSFTDLKDKTATPSGNTCTVNNIAKFGGSMYLDGAGDYLSIAHASDFNFGSGNFTIEFWYYPISQTGYSTIINGDQPDYPLAIYHGSLVNSGNVMAAIGPSGSAWMTNASNINFGAVTNGVWVHLALVRNGDSFLAFKDGALITTASTDSAGQAVGNIGTISLGINKTYYLSACIDDLRITKGVARYTSAFTPSEKPLPTNVPGPDHDLHWSKVVAASSFNAGLTESKNKAYTVYGNTAISTGQKKFGSASVAFDGSGDGLSLASSSDFDFGSGNFTIEMQVYRTVAATAYLCVRVNSATYCPFALYISANKLCFVGSVGGTAWDINITGNTDVPLNAWSHVAVTREGNIYRLWIDGVKCGEQTVTGSLMASTSPVFIGSTYDQTSCLTGNIDDFRITKGVARYTGGFNPPVIENILY